MNDAKNANVCNFVARIILEVKNVGNFLEDVVS